MPRPARAMLQGVARADVPDKDLSERLLPTADGPRRRVALSSEEVDLLEQDGEGRGG